MTRLPAAIAERAASLLALLGAWEGAAWFAHSRLFPGPGTVLATLADETINGDLRYHLGATLARAVLLYVWLGLTEAAAIAAVTLSKLPTVVVTLREGARALDADLAAMAKSFRLSAWRTLRHVTLPQLSPFFVIASRTGLALIWKIVLVVELLGRPDGIGYAIQVFFQLFDVKRLIAYSLAFVAVVLAIEWGILQPFERRLARWRR